MGGHDNQIEHDRLGRWALPGACRIPSLVYNAFKSMGIASQPHDCQSCTACLRVCCILLVAHANGENDVICLSCPPEYSLAEFMAEVQLCIHIWLAAWRYVKMRGSLHNEPRSACMTVSGIVNCAGNLEDAHRGGEPRGEHHQGV